MAIDGVLAASRLQSIEDLQDLALHGHGTRTVSTDVPVGLGHLPEPLEHLALGHARVCRVEKVMRPYIEALL